MLRYALSTRWLAWHLLCLVLVALITGLGVWQWTVATTGDGPGQWSVRNVVYALQWWIFAGFGVWFWFRFIRDQRDAEIEAAQAVETVTDLTTVSSASAPGSQAVADPQPAGDLGQRISLDGPAAERSRRLSGPSQTPKGSGF